MADLFSSPALVFNFSTQDLRVIMRNDAPWFFSTDVCEALDIANSRDAVSRLDEDEAGVATTDTRSANGVVQAREVSIINESGLYSLIMTSRKPEAKKFKKWVTAEVLPSIRKTGGYGQAAPSQDLYARTLKASTMFASTLKSLDGLGLNRVDRATRANQIVEQATGVDYMGMAGNPHQAVAFELFPVANSLDKLVLCISRGQRYKNIAPALGLRRGVELEHSVLLRAMHIKSKDFQKLVAKALDQNLITKKTVPGYAGAVYALVAGAAA